MTKIDELCKRYNIPEEDIQNVHDFVEGRTRGLHATGNLPDIETIREFVKVLKSLMIL